MILFGEDVSLETGKNLRRLCNNGQLMEALQYLDNMDNRGLQASPSDYVYILQKCMNMKALAEGRQVHSHMERIGMGNTILGRNLINMYAKCGSVEDARQIFDKMQKRDMFMWTDMIFGYAKTGHAGEALKLFWKMGIEGVKPDRVTFLSVLKACVNLRSLSLGKQIHGHLIHTELELDTCLGSALVDMYVKCGTIEDACKAFEGIPKQNVISWSTMIAGYVQHGHTQVALKLFFQMESEGVQPDEVTYIGVLKGCTNLAALDKGRQIHSLIIKNGCDANISVSSSLIDMYTKCGSIIDACEVFDTMPVHNFFSWSAMIAGYVHSGQADEAIKLSRQMRGKAVKPDQVTVVSILKACATIADLEEGKQTHALIIQSRFESRVFVGSALVDMYAKCGNVKDAQEVFDKMLVRDVVSWSAMIAGYSCSGFTNKALTVFQRMEYEGVKPNSFTFVSTLQACAGCEALEEGKQIHSRIVKCGSESNVFVGTSLVDMYARCGSIEGAEQVFNKLLKRNLVSWNAMIGGYARHNHAEEALILFWQMQSECIKPNAVTFVSVLKACASLAVLKQGKQIHLHIVHSGVEMETFVMNALVDMYAKCGRLDIAQGLFNDVPDKNVVSWNSMIGGYVQHGHSEEAFECFYLMEEKSVAPDDVTFVNILKACADRVSLEQVKMIHLLMIRSECDYGVLVYNTLIDMYAKTGSIEDARQVFYKISERNVVTWNVMIVGYAQHGLAEEALKIFCEMQHEDIKPNHITFIGVLSACSHAGFVHEGHFYFESMRQRHDIIPTEEHYACMLGLLVRSGCLMEVECAIEGMPLQITPIMEGDPQYLQT